MKTLIESLLDDEKELLDRLNIPKKPKVKKEECVCYLQAWYNIIEQLCREDNLTPETWALILKGYKDWQSEWFCHLDYETYEAWKEEHDDYFDWHVDYINFVDKNDPLEQRMWNDYIDNIIKDFENGGGKDRVTPYGSNSLLVSLFGDENIFRLDALKYDLYRTGLKYEKIYNKFYKDIVKLLKVFGVKVR